MAGGRNAIYTTRQPKEAVANCVYICDSLFLLLRTKNRRRENRKKQDQEKRRKSGLPFGIFADFFSMQTPAEKPSFSGVKYSMKIFL